MLKMYWKRLELTHMFKEIFDIKSANYIPKPEISALSKIINDFDINSSSAAMFDDIAKNLVPAKKLALLLYG